MVKRLGLYSVKSALFGAALFSLNSCGPEGSPSGDELQRISAAECIRMGLTDSLSKTVPVKTAADTCAATASDEDSRTRSAIAAGNAAILYSAYAATLQNSDTQKSEALRKALDLSSKSQTELAIADSETDEARRKFSATRATALADAQLQSGMLPAGVSYCGGKTACLEKGVQGFDKLSNPDAKLTVLWALAKSELASQKGNTIGVETAIASLKQVIASGSDVGATAKAKSSILDIASQHRSAPFIAEARQIAQSYYPEKYPGLSLDYANALAAQAKGSSTDDVRKAETYCKAANAYAASVQAAGLSVSQKAKAHEERGNALYYLNGKSSGTCTLTGVGSGLQQAALTAYKESRTTSGDASGMSGLAVENFANLLRIYPDSKLTPLTIYNEANATARNPNDPRPLLEEGKELLRNANGYSTQAEAKLRSASTYAEANKYPKVAAEAYYLMAKNKMQIGGSADAINWAERAVQLDPKSEYRNQACKAHLQANNDSFAGDAYCDTLMSSADGGILKAMMLYRKAQIDHRKNNSISAFRDSEDAFVAISGGSSTFYGPKGIGYQSGDVKAFGQVIAKNCGRSSGAPVTRPSASAEKAQQLFVDFGLFSCK